MAYGNMQMNMGMPGNMGNPSMDMPRWLQMMRQRMQQPSQGVVPAGADVDMAKLLGLVPQGYMPGAGRNPYGPMGSGMRPGMAGDPRAQALSAVQGGMSNMQMGWQPPNPGAVNMQQFQSKFGGVQGNNMLRGMGGIGLGGGMMMNPSVMGR